MSSSTKIKSEELKKALLEKLKKAKSNIKAYKNELNSNNNIEELRDNYKYFINLYYNNYINFIGNRKTNNGSNKDILDLEYFKIIKILNNLQAFTLNMENVVLNSIDNYNIFLSSQLPYYKDLGKKFMIKEGQKLGYNHIFSKLTNNQISILYDKTKEKCLLSFINKKNPFKININKENLLISLSHILSKNQKKQIELNNFENNEDFNSSLALIDTIKRSDSKTEEFCLQNCELKNSDFSLIPFDIYNLKIINSKISSSIFVKAQFNNLISLVLDNTDLDSISFEIIFKMLLKKNCQICNNLKLFSAKNNSISRIIQDKDIENIKNKLTSLEIFNLSNNNISNVNIKLFDLIPNLKIMDLSKNSLNREDICQDIINKFHGMVILINNIGIMSRKMNQNYIKYYIDKLNSNEYPVDSINTESLVYKRNCDNILNINFIAIKNKYNIREINLSSCFINDDNMIKILNNCIKFNNSITKLNLSNNLLTHVFFELSLKNSLGIILDKLVELDLSFNDIKLIKANKAKENLFVNFTNSFNHLHLFNIKETPLEATFNNYIKVKVNKYHAGKMNRSITISIDELGSQINEIIDKKYLNINDNFRFVMNATVHDKYFRQLDVILPFFEKHFNITKIPRPK